MRVFSTILALALGAVASAGQWNVTADNIGAIAIGVASNAAETVFVPASQSDGSSAVYKSVDGGHKFSAAPVSGILMGLDAHQDEVVGGGMFTLLASTNGGKSYNATTQIGGSVATSQDTAVSPNGQFVVVGSTFTGGNGVFLSTDAKNFNWHNISATSTMVRYAASPSNSVIYVTAGTWGDSSQELAESYLKSTEGVQFVNQRFAVDHANHQMVPLWQYKLDNGYSAAMESAASGSSSNDASGYMAQIVKSTDGGQTWTQVYNDATNEFYFNAIACKDEQNCCAVAEADSGAGAGARILCTTNGGSSWSQNLFVQGAQYSMMSIAYAPDGTWHAGGANMGGSLTGLFYTSTDMATWTATQQLPGYYAADIVFPSGTNGYAAALNSWQMCSLLAYTA
jgi:photosystem II stability/assembly factor-like uncharacterized protein